MGCTLKLRSILIILSESSFDPMITIDDFSSFELVSVNCQVTKTSLNFDTSFESTMKVSA